MNSDEFCTSVCPESKQYSRVRFRTVTQAGNMWQMPDTAAFQMCDGFVECAINLRDQIT